jgi:hypothetical protein
VGGKVQVGNLGASPDDIDAAVEAYLTANPPAAGEPLLADHIVSPTPHVAYDDDMGLITYFENGLA